jgi:hypothetical protein
LVRLGWWLVGDGGRSDGKLTVVVVTEVGVLVRCSLLCLQDQSQFQVRRWSEEGIRHSGVFCDTFTHTNQSRLCANTPQWMGAFSKS